MQYTVRFGVPVKALKHLGNNPKHPGLNSHEIEELSSFVGVKIFESYIENDCPRARRIFWAYGPERTEITVLGSDNHLNKKKGYLKVHLSKFP